jgi:hypothetical protein
MSQCLLTIDVRPSLKIVLSVAVFENIVVSFWYAYQIFVEFAHLETYLTNISDPGAIFESAL